jgi:hypothetical protein
MPRTKPTIPASWQQSFERLILPAIDKHGRVYFRDFNPDKREEAIAEARALGWKHYVACRRRGKDPARFRTTFAAGCCQGVRNGRKAAGGDPVNEVLSPVAQHQKGFRVLPLPQQESSESRHELIDALQDPRQRPADQAQFNLDTAEFLREELDDRDRQLLHDMAAGETTQALAERSGLSSSRISQKRRDFVERYRRWVGDGQDEQQGRGR